MSPGGVEHCDRVCVCALLPFLGVSGPWLVFLEKKVISRWKGMIGTLVDTQKVYESENECRN
jgi:hypothetical protein